MLCVTRSCLVLWFVDSWFQAAAGGRSGQVVYSSSRSCCSQYHCSICIDVGAVLMRLQ
jgi:hypothetical protein